jgi:hypothetical protein
MDEGLVALAVVEPGDAAERAGEVGWGREMETVHVTVRRRCGAAVGGRVEDVSLRGSWR